MHSSSPYINFLLYPSACPFGGNSGVCLFFLHVETEQRPFQKRGIRDRSGREVPRRDTNAFLLSILRSTGCVSPVKEKREKGKVANRFFPFIVTFARAHTHPCCEKLFPFSFPTCTTRLSCKRKNSLASTFPTDLWQTLFVHFFLSLFFFFFFSEPRIQEILDFRHRITAENSDRFISTLVSVYKTWIFLAAIN